MQNQTDEWQAEIVCHPPSTFRCPDCGHNAVEVTWFGSPTLPDLNLAAVNEKYRGDLTPVRYLRCLQRKVPLMLLVNIMERELNEEERELCRREDPLETRKQMAILRAQIPQSTTLTINNATIWDRNPSKYLMHGASDMPDQDITLYIDAVNADRLITALVEMHGLKWERDR